MKRAINSYERSWDKINYRAEAFFDLYKQELMQGDETLTRFEIEGDGTITLYWFVTWAYGGRDDGSIKIPLEAFTGDWEAWIKSKKEELLAKEAADKAKEATATKEKEIADLERLKKKYEGSE